MTGSTSQHRNPARRIPFPLFDDEDELSSNSSSSTSAFPPSLRGQLPSNHFLAPRPISPDQHALNQRSSDDSAIDTSSLAAADFDVSVETGFLPPQEPIQSLAGLGRGWDRMESCLKEATKEVSRCTGGGVGKLSEQFRQSVRSLPSVDISILTTLPLLRRAHTLLAHLTHYYMHSSFPSQTVVPASLSIPLVHTSEKLGIPPILTYADTVLWVWKLLDPTKPLRADNVDITTQFTHSPSERAFFLLSLFCELNGPTILRLMSSTLDETFFSDRVALSRIGRYLESISLLIDELSVLMRDAVKGEFGPKGNRQSIEPSVFYWEIRPWFNGGKWTYERVGPNGEDVEMEFGGPSAGQSSLVHAIDLFLGVDHAPRNNNNGAQSGGGGGGPKSGLTDSTFMQRMSAYMPHHHRSFLQHLVSIHDSSSSPSSLPSLRSLALQYPIELQASYDLAVASMKKFRDTHIILATHFIVAQARHPPSIDSVHFMEWETKRLAKEQAEIVRKREGREKDAREVVVGTGGTDLSSFLKLCRDRTKEALLQQQ
ncbi:dioxygenase BNA2 [Sporobolomyces salmoneus]|uniref:dioxygenase BNA2 n=1 Tax=Sporobolomyces salmoneus TaxID=183962 RepID=UPI0031791E84